MGPHRETPASPDDSPASGAVDDRGLAWVALLVGLIPCLATLLSGGPWGAQPTVGLLVAVLAAALLIRPSSAS